MSFFNVFSISGKTQRHKRNDTFSKRRQMQMDGFAAHYVVWKSRIKTFWLITTYPCLHPHILDFHMP